MFKFIFIDRLNCRAISEGKNAKATKSQGIDTSINQQFKSSSDKIASVATKSSFFNIHDDYHYNYQVLFFSKGKG